MGSHTNTAFIGVDSGFSERKGCKYKWWWQMPLSKGESGLWW